MPPRLPERTLAQKVLAAIVLLSIAPILCLATGGVGLVLTAVVAEAGLLFLILRHLVLTPLERLARHPSTTDPTRDETAKLDDLLARRDEIGALGRALTEEHARAQALLASLETRVRERTAELERATEAKSRFLANMSHELRTPLNGVIALSDALGKRQHDRESREMADLIVSSGRLLESVLTDILDFSKIDAGQLRIEQTEFDLETMVFRIAELHRAAAELKGLSFVWTIEPSALGSYVGDPVRITQLLSNLLSNAVKFTPEGEVSLAVENLPTSGVRFRVSDTGIGFDSAVSGRLFNRFEQADSSTTRRFGGSGLGLAICASLVELMGGEVTAESEPGKGARFQIDLPLERVASPGPDLAQAEPGPCSLDRLKVLLAEDHPTNQRIVELVLCEVGVDLTVASDGAEALEALAQERFDVILMDMQMPIMDGPTAVRELRLRERELGLARTPVIMLTANALAEHVEIGRLAGADRHMAKPLRPDALIRLIAECAAGLDEAVDEAAA